MRVLWFSINNSNYISPNSSIEAHGGWVSALEKIVACHDEIKLAVAFESKDNIFKSIQHKVTYYPINTNKFQRLKRKINIYEEERQLIPLCLNVLNDYKPDLIHIFGSEWCYGLVRKYTNIPIVIHLQGCLPQYSNSKFPPSFSYFDKVRYHGINIKAQIGERLRYYNTIKRAVREERNLSLNNYFMGRTDWDYSLVKLYNPKSIYFLCNEALNSIFVKSIRKWGVRHNEKLILMTIGTHFLKGIDVIYKTALLLTKSHVNFEWLVAGSLEEDAKLVELKLKLEHSNVHITFLGKITHEDVYNHLLSCDFYVHPAYAENSPNSICEAQILGVPVLATFCGGIPSLIENNKTGILVPENDPYYLASKIIMLKDNKPFQSLISKNEILVATTRHDPDKIYNQLIYSYNKILSLSNRII